jgi:hypothetical protein
MNSEKYSRLSPRNGTFARHLTQSPMKSVLFLFLILFGTRSQAQVPIAADSSGTSRTRWAAQQRAGTWLVGSGVTFVGLTAKGGRFLSDRWWVGGEAEVHHLLSTRHEAGLFARRYQFWDSWLSSFIGAGASYGRFEEWDMDMDNVRPDPPVYRTAKLNLLAGFEFHFSERVSLELAAKVGRLGAVNWLQPSFQASANLTLGQKRR